MTERTRLEQQMQDAARRWRAEERDKGLAALILGLKDCPDNVVAFLWLARCVPRPAAKAERRIPRPTPAHRAR